MTSAAVTNWPERLALTALLLGLFVAAVAGMRRGWLRRAARQGDIAAPATALSGAGDVLIEALGTFVGTSREGDWLDRIVVHDLGVPSQATLVVRTDGVLLQRRGARDLALPGSDVLAARIDRAVGADVVDAAVVITWRNGSDRLETGFRPREGAAMTGIIAALRRITEVTS